MVAQHSIIEFPDKIISYVLYELIVNHIPDHNRVTFGRLQKGWQIRFLCVM